MMHKEVVPMHSFFFVQSLAIYFVPTLLHAHVMWSHDLVLYVLFSFIP